MDRVLVAFIRHRVIGNANVDLGELLDAADRFFNGKLEPREFFSALNQVSRDRRIRRRNRVTANDEHNGYS
ncbi:hypothetical protein LVY75_35440 (plasmid) [Sinorhizobium sp. B11]|jgi:hypothetical protein|uniref:hypothetical protein n=1 Tax=unclassified Rhizobium TaxID=2613769 RepID=UPI00037E1CF5|nr:MULTISPECIES: hypothetical protein [unclassified Rhizobium]MBB3447104.1 hypothetical protein [Rhizobium sp. BK379]MBB3565632.1 hypothetical protein [Rhizobium sp. BK512]